MHVEYSQNDDCLACVQNKFEVSVLSKWMLLNGALYYFSLYKSFLTFVNTHLVYSRKTSSINWNGTDLVTQNLASYFPLSKKKNKITLSYNWIHQMTITLEHTINENETENGILNSFEKCFVERRTPTKLEIVFTKIRWDEWQ